MTRTHKVLATVAVLAAVAGGSAGALAVFTDQAGVTGNTFGTGTVDITTSPTSQIVSYAAPSGSPATGGMAPGDSDPATGGRLLTVANSGTLQLRYALSVTATNTDTKGLRGQLQLEVKGVDATTPGTGTECDNFDGASIYSGALDANATTGRIFGDAAQGAHAGDRVLNAGMSEVLCFRATLPLSTGNAFQGASTTATFSFDAEQTKNN